MGFTVEKACILRDLEAFDTLYKPSDEPQEKIRLQVCRGCRILTLQCTVVCGQDKMDITYFLRACPLPFFFLNIIVTIADITVLGQHISVFCLDGRVTGAEKVKKKKGKESERTKKQKNFDPAEMLHHHAPKTTRVASRCHATVHECKRRLSALFLLV
jgi:hypothetical protein